MLMFFHRQVLYSYSCLPKSSPVTEDKLARFIFNVITLARVLVFSGEVSTCGLRGRMSQ